MKAFVTTILLFLVAAVAAQAQPIVINEINYSSLETQDSGDWIELYNRGFSTETLTGWVIQDEGVGSFTLPSVTLAPGQYLIICQDIVLFGAIHPTVSAIGSTIFGFSSTGGTVRVLNSFGSVIDEVNYDNSKPWPREASGKGPTLSLISPTVDNSDPLKWGPSEEIQGTPGAANGNLRPEGFWSSPGDGDTVVTDNLVITGNVQDRDGTVVQIRMYESGTQIGTITPSNGSFTFTWPVVTSGDYDFVMVTVDNEGAEGTSSKLDLEIFTNDPCSPAPAELIITEINYNSTPPNDPGDWVEIYNNSSFAADLTGWKLRDSGADTTLTAGYTLQPSEYAVLIREPAQFFSVFFGVPIAGEFSFGLKNSGELIQLLSPTGCIVDEVEYDDSAPWPLDADGLGPTLELKNVSLDNALAESWGASSGNGTPGGENSVALPVELVSFVTEVIEDGILLQWETATESENAGFGVEHRIGDASFEEIAFISGAGTTEQAQSYETLFADPEPGTHSFRLRQVDFDGTTVYTNEVEVAVAMTGEYMLMPAFPNPANSLSNIRFGSRDGSEVTVSVFDLTGQRVALLYKGAPSGDQLERVQFDTSRLSAGTYFVELRSRTARLARPVVVVK